VVAYQCAAIQMSFCLRCPVFIRAEQCAAFRVLSAVSPTCPGPHAGEAQLSGSNRKVLGAAGIQDPISSCGEKSAGPLSAQQGEQRKFFLGGGLYCWFLTNYIALILTRFLCVEQLLCNWLLSVAVVLKARINAHTGHLCVSDRVLRGGF